MRPESSFSTEGFTTKFRDDKLLRDIGDLFISFAPGSR